MLLRNPHASELSVTPRAGSTVPSIPLIVEPADPTATSALPSTISSHAQQLCTLLDQHGALLLRGWDVKDAATFAKAVSALGSSCGLHSLSDYFPAEHGRDERELHGETTVWPTNTLQTTGAYLQPEVVPHTENFYAHPQPRVLCFCCERAPWLGGETALFDGRAAVQSLPPRLRARLAEPCAVHRVHSLARLLSRHGVHFQQSLSQLMEDSGAELRHIGGGDEGSCASHIELIRRVTVASQTPPPALDPSSSSPSSAAADVAATAADVASPRMALPPAHDCGRSRRVPPLHVRFNFGELCHSPAARHALLRGLLARGLFAGRAWAVHRFLWAQALRRPETVGRLLSAVDSLPGWLWRPRRKLQALIDARGVASAARAIASCGHPRRTGRSKGRSRGGMRAQAAKAGAATVATETVLPTLSERLSDREAEQVAAALAEHVAVFAWRKGDMLIVDNCRLLHDGLPGAGPRRLRVALMGEA